MEKVRAFAKTGDQSGGLGVERARLVRRIHEDVDVDSGAQRSPRAIRTASLSSRSTFGGPIRAVRQVNRAEPAREDEVASAGPTISEMTSPRLLPSARARRLSSRKTEVSMLTVVRVMMRDAIDWGI